MKKNKRDVFSVKLKEALRTKLKAQPLDKTEERYHKQTDDGIECEGLCGVWGEIFFFERRL